jgi:diguanylate cyclase (GGDEF)-like protein
VVGTVLAGVNAVPAWGPASGLQPAYQLAAFGSVAGVLAGIRLNRPPVARPWLVMAAGLATLVVGDAFEARRGVLLHGDRDASVGDVAHLLGYVLLAAGLLLLAHDRRPGDRAGRLESWIVSAGAALIFVELLIRPSLDAGPGTTAGTMVSVAYPACDVLLVLGLTRLATASAGRTRAGRLILIAGGLLLVADTISILLGLHATPDHRPGDLLRLLSYTGFAAASLHPTMAVLASPATRTGPAGPNRWRLLAVGLATLIVPGVLAAEELLGVDHDNWAVIVGSIVLSGLVFARMAVAIEQIAEVNRSRAELQDQLAYDAAHDSLTQLPNRARGLALTRRALARDRGAGGSTALLFIDLDGFKHVNDTLGHRSGDEVLRRVADRLRDSVRGDDSPIRYGGDEFLVLLRGVGEAEVALSVARRLIATLSEPITLAGNTARIGASAGVSLATGGTTDAATLIHEADAAAYVAKSSGRGRAQLYDADMRRVADRRRVLEQDLQAAIGRDELVLHYQPIVDSHSGAVEGYEALVRWDRPGAALLPPEFLPIAEQSDLICDVDRWVLEQAAAQLVRWAETLGDDGPYVSVNLSPRHVARSRVIHDVAHALTASGADPSRLVVETGEAVLTDLAHSVAHLRRLRELGVRVSLDDFGSGFNSLSRLADLPVDMVKIDRRYVDVGATDSAKLLHLMIQGAHLVGLSAVAQGVEHDVQLATLRSLDCEAVQGFHIARPMPAEEAEAYFRNRAMDPFEGLLTGQVRSTGSAAATSSPASASESGGDHR